MLTTLSPGELPTARPKNYPETDIANFGELWLAANEMEGQCLQREKIEAGWTGGGEFRVISFSAFYVGGISLS